MDGDVGGRGCVSHIHGKDLGVGCVGAEGANVLITGEDVSKRDGFEEAAWVELCSLDEGLADGNCVMGWWVVGVVVGAAPLVEAVEGSGESGELMLGSSERAW
jgi:hypothetical protein